MCGRALQTLYRACHRTPFVPGTEACLGSWLAPVMIRLRGILGTAPDFLATFPVLVLSIWNCQVFDHTDPRSVLHVDHELVRESIDDLRRDFDMEDHSISDEDVWSRLVDCNFFGSSPVKVAVAARTHTCQ